MRSLAITRARRDFLQLVEAGEPFVITRRGVRIAQLVFLPQSAAHPECEDAYRPTGKTAATLRLGKRKKPAPKPQPSLPKEWDFEELWAAYGREGNKNAALSALCSMDEPRPPHETLDKCIDLYLVDIAYSDIHKAHFSTWLNGRRWEKYEALIKEKEELAKELPSILQRQSISGLEAALEDDTIQWSEEDRKSAKEELEILKVKRYDHLDEIFTETGLDAEDANEHQKLQAELERAGAL